MHPITRKEQYLNRLAGEQAQAIPAEPITREEQYLGRLCGENNVIPEEPRTRKEIYLANLCGEDVTPPAEAITRIEQYMAFASGERETKPSNPLTREEWYWDKYQGGEVPEEKTIAFTNIITVTDALARPAVDLQSEITATQNLNGYEYPWVGGAGKNLLPKLQDGTYSGNGVQAVVKDGIATLSGITTTSGNALIIPLDEAVTVPNQTCYVHWLNSDVNFGIAPSIELSTDIQNTGISASFASVNRIIEVPSNRQGVMVDRCRFWLAADRTLSGTFAPMICLTDTATAYAPYENICPISGRTEVNVTRTGNEPYEGDTFNTELGRTVYGGTLDFTTGELTITHAIGDLTGYTNYYFDADKHILTIRVDDKDSGYYHIISDRYRNIYNELPLEIDNGVMTEKIGNSFLFIRNDNYNTLEEFMASLTGTQFVYKLKTPQTISLTPTEVMMLENNNTIWADSGRVQLTYLSRAAERVQLMNASLKANTLKLTKGAIKE